MHCPKCGTLIESDDVSYCSRCGFTIGGVRALISSKTDTGAPAAISVGGLNMGVVLMFIGMLPALLAVMTSPIALPAAFLFLSIAYIAILLGSGKLLKLFSSGDSPIPEELLRARRKEIAFGSTLMFVGTLLATFLVALVPDAWARTALITFIPATFAILLLSSQWLFASLRELTTTGNSRLLLTGGTKPASQLVTGDLEAGISPIDFDNGQTCQLEYTETPPSVTDGTTRLLREETE